MEVRRLCLPGQLRVGGAAAAYYRCQQPPRPRHDQPTPTHCIDALYTINVLCLIKDSNELITME